VDGVRVVLRLLVLFALITPFWSLFDQKASTWVLQGESMALPGWGWFKTASQMQSLNPALVMLLLPFNNLVLYPALKRAGLELTPLRRMSLGIAFSGLAWVAVGFLQLHVEAMKAQGAQVPVLWQALPYALLTFGEALVSATGLEFAYSQAPARMKSVVSAFWSLAVTIGNLWVLLVNVSVKSATVTDAIKGQGLSVMASQMFFFAAFAFAAALVFAAFARRYVVVDNYRKA
jgi:POT family proton-dependent oligopeptide transporter